MSAKADAVTSQTAAQANKTRTGTRHDASISAGGTGGIAVVPGETGGSDEGIALIEKRASHRCSVLHRSAELYSAVSHAVAQSCTLLGDGKLRRLGPIQRSAEYNWAIRQIENLPYASALSGPPRRGTYWTRRNACPRSRFRSPPGRG